MKSICTNLKKRLLMQFEIKMMHKRNHNMGDSHLHCHAFSLELSTQTKTWWMKWVGKMFKDSNTLSQMWDVTKKTKENFSTLTHFESCNFIGDSNIWNKVWHLDHASRCFHCGVQNFHLTSSPPLDHHSGDKVKRVIVLY
jgi:hypothetical protein